MYVGASKNIGNGVRVGAGTGVGDIGKGLLLLVLILPWALWVGTGLSILVKFGASLLGSDVKVDMEDAKLNVLCFIVTLIEAGLYFGFGALL